LNRRREGLKGEAPPKKAQKTKAVSEAEIKLPDIDGGSDGSDVGNNNALPPVPDLDDDDGSEGSDGSEWEA